MLLFLILSDEFIDLNAFTKLSRILEPTKEYNAKTECILRALNALSKSSEFYDDSPSHFQLRGILQEIIEYNNSLPECEVMYLKIF